PQVEGFAFVEHGAPGDNRVGIFEKLEAPFHAGRTVTGDGTVVRVAGFGDERDAGRSARVYDGLTLDAGAFKRDVVREHLGVDDDDTNTFTLARLQEWIADAINRATHAAVTEYGSFEAKLAVDRLCLHGSGLEER